MNTKKPSVDFVMGMLNDLHKEDDIVFLTVSVVDRHGDLIRYEGVIPMEEANYKFGEKAVRGIATKVLTQAMAAVSRNPSALVESSDAEDVALVKELLSKSFKTKNGE